MEQNMKQNWPDKEALFPEENNWSEVLDSHKLTDLAERLSRYCRDDLQTASRERVAGLRLALNTLRTVDEESRR